MTINHQFWAPHESGGGDRPRNVQLWATVRSSNAPWSCQGHISMHNTSSTTCTPNHVTAASRSTEIWPFECREISTFREVWTLVIAFLEENFKIWLDKLWARSHTITSNHQFLPARESGGGDRPRSVQLWAIVGSSNAPSPSPWPWMRSTSYQHTQYE